MCEGMEEPAGCRKRFCSGRCLELVSRIGVIGIVLEDRESAAQKVNFILSEYSKMIVGRMGIPYRDRNISVISLIVDGSTDDIGAMTGKLGTIKGVRVKTALITKGL